MFEKGWEVRELKTLNLILVLWAPSNLLALKVPQLRGLSRWPVDDGAIRRLSSAIDSCFAWAIGCHGAMGSLGRVLGGLTAGGPGSRLLEGLGRQKSPKLPKPCAITVTIVIILLVITVIIVILVGDKQVVKTQQVSAPKVEVTES